MSGLAKAARAQKDTEPVTEQEFRGSTVNHLHTIDKETRISLGLLITILVLVVGAYGMVVSAESRLTSKDAEIESRVNINEASMRDMKESLQALNSEIRELGTITHQASTRNAELNGSIEVLNERLKRINP